MSEVTRAHLAGLKLALAESDIGNTESISVGELQSLIAQASAAPEQETITVAIYSDATPYSDNDEWLRTKPFALVVRDEGVSHHLQRRVPGVQDVTIAYTHADDGEVERLRAENAALRAAGEVAAGAIPRLDAARKKLAEAQALLEDWYTANCIGEVNVSDKVYRIVTRTAAFLSATAQPAEVKS